MYNEGKNVNPIPTLYFSSQATEHRPCLSNDYGECGGVVSGHRTGGGQGANAEITY